MITLYRKELHGLLPLLALVALVFGGGLLLRPLSERLDEITWEAQSGHLQAGEGQEYALLLMTMALIAAYSVFPREHDEGTIELLYALPITRGRIFAAKASAAWTVLIAGIVLDQFAGALFQALNPQSFGGEQWHFGLAIRIVLLDGVYSAVILTHGLLISFLRRFGLVVYGLVALTVVQIKRFAPGHAYLDPNELLELRFRGSELIWPWHGLLVHSGIALVAGALAYALWMGRAEGITHLYARMRSHLAGRIALGCVPATIIFAGLTWMAVIAVEEAEETETVHYRAFLPVRAETRWYDFTYPASSSDKARSLLREADRVYEEVAAALGLGTAGVGTAGLGMAGLETGPRIDADLTDQGSGHLGIAQGGVIRVALATLSAEDALMTLYHETVHALQFKLADGRVAEHMSSLRCFVEGSAVYVSSELLPDEPARRAHRRLAAAAYDRHAIRFEELIDDRQFTAVHDTNLVYVLGETWTAALAQACGGGAIGGFFRALGRDDAPEDLAGMALWQDTLGAAGCALEVAVARWGESMNHLVSEERDFLDRLPRLGGGVVEVEDGELVFRLRLDREVPAPAETYYLRVRAGPEAPEDEIYTFTAQLEPDGTGAFFRVPQAWLAGDAFELQFGQSITGSLWPLFEDWQAGSYDLP